MNISVNMSVFMAFWSTDPPAAMLRCTYLFPDIANSSTFLLTGYETVDEFQMDDIPPTPPIPDQPLRAVFGKKIREPSARKHTLPTDPDTEFHNGKHHVTTDDVDDDSAVPRGMMQESEDITPTVGMKPQITTVQTDTSTTHERSNQSMQFNDTEDGYEPVGTPVECNRHQEGTIELPRNLTQGHEASGAKHSGHLILTGTIESQYQKLIRETMEPNF